MMARFGEILHEIVVAIRAGPASLAMKLAAQVCPFDPFLRHQLVLLGDDDQRHAHTKAL